MVKQTVVHAYHEILFINSKKEPVIHTYKIWMTLQKIMLSQGIPKGYTVYTSPFI